MHTRAATTLSCLAALLLVPALLWAQPGVRVETHEDEMGSWSYAYTRADRGPLDSIGDDEVVFGRSPCLVFLCRDGELEVIYLFDTELIGADGTVSVQSRLGDAPASRPRPWALVVDPTWTAEFEAGMAVLGAEDNPIIEMMGSSSIAARLRGEEAVAFLDAALEADIATMRVMDTFDGETHTDRFSLEGLAGAAGELGLPCGP